MNGSQGFIAEERFSIFCMSGIEAATFSSLKNQITCGSHISTASYRSIRRQFAPP
jgi:hypothetical protein